MKNRAIFIISYKRADNVVTLDWLKKNGYNGKWYIVIDDKDPEMDRYLAKYGGNVCIFSKEETKKLFDTCDNFSNTNSSCFVRNALFGIAKEKGIDSFLVLDDDYDNIMFRRPKPNGVLGGANIKEGDLNTILDICFDYLEKTLRINCYALSQNGDFIGGADSFQTINGKRKIMNAFFFRTDNPTEFKGKMNEDVNAYLYWGARGRLYFTTCALTVKQALTQTVSGGMPDIYKNNGTYIKSFYSVIVAPNAVKISVIGAHSPRIHHKINWNNAVPKLIRESYKK